MWMMGDMGVSEMFNRNRCVLLKSQIPLTNFVSPRSIAEHSGVTFNIQPPMMHYENLTATAGIYLIPVSSDVPHFTAVLNGLSKRKLRREAEVLTQGPVQALKFSRDAVTYTYHYDEFSSAAGVSLQYRLFAAMKPFTITLLSKKDDASGSKMWDNTVQIPLQGNDSTVIRFIPAKEIMSDTVENIEVTIPENGVIIIPARTLYKLNYDIPDEKDHTILLTTVLACGSNLNQEQFHIECSKSIRYTETTTRINLAAWNELRNSSNFEKLCDEDFNHMMLCTMHPSSSNAPTVRDISADTGTTGFHFGDSN